MLSCPRNRQRCSHHLLAGSLFWFVPQLVLLFFFLTIMTASQSSLFRSSFVNLQIVSVTSFAWMIPHRFPRRSIGRTAQTTERYFFSAPRNGFTPTCRSTNSSPITSRRTMSTRQPFHEHDASATASNTKPGADRINVSNDEQDTIFALSSGHSTQPTAVAVIRITGPRAFSILQSMMLKPNKNIAPRKATLLQLHHPHQKQIILDQALVLYFPQPHSFTGEDVVEIHSHGSRAVVAQLLHVLSSTESSSHRVVRLAEPGEFTQRAFGAGKLDVLQTEALADLLHSETSAQSQQALQQLDGRLSRVYQQWRSSLIQGLAHAEAVIDFGDDEHLDDDDLEDNDIRIQQERQQQNIWGNIQVQIRELCESMQKQLQDQRRGEIVREGLQVSIVGPPNAGKSSLFNILSNRDAAIVSPTAGTTRDVLEVSLNLGGVKCILQDTAGVRTSTEDLIEQEGIKRTKQAAEKADMIVTMVDISDATHGIDILKEILDIPGVDPSNVILVLNKADLVDSEANGKQSPSSYPEELGGIYEISCTTQSGIDHFLDSLSSKVKQRISAPGSSDDSGRESEGVLITRARHRQHIQAATEALERFLILSNQGMVSVDLAAEELRLAASELGRITGAVDVEDVLDKLFSDFCIGK